MYTQGSLSTELALIVINPRQIDYVTVLSASTFILGGDGPTFGCYYRQESDNTFSIYFNTAKRHVYQYEENLFNHL